jgi:hypothetical protein
MIGRVLSAAMASRASVTRGRAVAFQQVPPVREAAVLRFPAEASQASSVLAGQAVVVDEGVFQAAVCFPVLVAALATRRIGCPRSMRPAALQA